MGAGEYSFIAASCAYSQRYLELDNIVNIALPAAEDAKQFNSEAASFVLLLVFLMQLPDKID